MRRRFVIGKNGLFRKSSRKQFEKLFLPHIDAAYNLARYLCGSAYDADDIVQEAYLRAYRAFGKFTDSNSRAWILTITRNTCYSWMRKYNMSACTSFDEATDSETAEGHSPDFSREQSPEYIAEKECTRQHIRLAIESLPLEFREVTILRELEELSYQEIGLILGIPNGTVMSRLSRARNRLRILLDNMHEVKNNEMQ